LVPGALARYQLLTRQPVQEPRPVDRLRIDFIAQRGGYDDVTCVLEDAEPAYGDVYVVFADHVDVTHTALPLFAAAVTLGLRLYSPRPSTRRAPATMGRSCAGPVQTMIGLVVEEYGPGVLRLLHSLVRVTPYLLDHFATDIGDAAAEPKLSLAVVSYARTHQVHLVTTTQPMVRLGIDWPRAAVGMRPGRP
jgi:hypothetical protein